MGVVQVHLKNELCIDVVRGSELDEHQRLHGQVEITFMEPFHQDVAVSDGLFRHEVVHASVSRDSGQKDEASF